MENGARTEALCLALSIKGQAVLSIFRMCEDDQEKGSKKDQLMR
jgi:hypothetical protein